MLKLWLESFGRNIQMTKYFWFPVAGRETSELLDTFVFSVLFVALVWLFSVLFQVWSSGYWVINDCKGNLCCSQPIPNVKSAAVFLPPVAVRCYQKI